MHFGKNSCRIEEGARHGPLESLKLESTSDSDKFRSATAMHRCASPEHPHCSTWVLPGEPLCEHGHAQPRPADEHRPASEPIGASFDMISRLRATREARDAIRSPAPAPGTAPTAEPALRPHLHISGFDPRAAGGRQTVKLELRGMPADAPARLALLLRSDLLAEGGARLAFTRGLRGEWRPVFIEFSSRGREHGQYRIDVELHAEDGAARTWVATLVLLVPRADASLGEIHQTYLSTHKNVRVHADDGSIASLYGLEEAGPMDIEIGARNAAIAQIDFGTAGNGAHGGGGKIDLALPTLAWDEDLIEIDQQAAPSKGSAHPCPATSACLVYAEPDAGAPRHLRLFALDECVLGRFEGDGIAPEADLLLQHHGDAGPEAGGLTRRLSARHALVRACRHGFEIEDVSRYGLLLDGVWPGRHKPVPLRLGMRIELTASIRGVVTLVVTALHPHALVLHRVDGGGAAECFMLLAPGHTPAADMPADLTSAARDAPATALPRAAALPLLFHRGGGFWHRDPASGRETPLTPAAALEQLSGFKGLVRFTAQARPEAARPDGTPPVPAHDARRAERRHLPAARLLGA